MFNLLKQFHLIVHLDFSLIPAFPDLSTYLCNLGLSKDLPEKVNCEDLTS